MENPIQKIYNIKHMVCTRCIMVVQNIFEDAHFQILNLELGEVVVLANPYSHSDEDLNIALRRFGLELLESEDDILVEKIKTTIVSFVHQSEFLPKTNLSEYISQSLDLPYTQLRSVFKTKSDMTVEKFYILQKVERAKELIQYNDLSIKEIAYKLGYSSLQHLSNQFKGVTGFSPKAYKDQGVNLRIPIEEVGMAMAS